MKLDYEYLKKILITMEENPTHQILLSKLKKQIFEEGDDKFIGHIKVLFDINCIEANNNNTGFEINAQGDLIFYDSLYRLTAKGYEFLDILKNKTIFNKIKNFTISNAFDIGKQMLVTWGIKKVIE